MNDSWNLGRIAGVKLRIHWTFLLLPLWVFLSAVFAGSGTAVAVTSVIFILAIFGCVVLHELGHALAARHYGIGTRDITLLPIGGVAALERMPRNPLQEFVIAIAGPMVNVVIAAAIFLGLPFIWSDFLATTNLGSFLLRLGWVNVALVVFNLIPAFPMDGGRILRSVLATFLAYDTATRIAATVGQVAAVALGIVGLLMGNLLLVFVAGFIFLAARGEVLHLAMSGSGQTQSGRDVYYIGDEVNVAVPAETRADSVAAWLSSQNRSKCAVINGGRVIGVITLSELARALELGKGTLPVAELLPA